MKFQMVYIEKEIEKHPRTQAICSSLKEISYVLCDSYTEIFNRKAQNYRLQKQKPSLILAKKRDHFVLDIDKGYGIGGEKNYYFSHMLNCLYDCRYCFLRGMYRSAHPVIFVNVEDFLEEVSKKVTSCQEKSYFFAGYDSDSLVFESLVNFLPTFLPFVEKHPQACFEMRTKCTNITPLLSHNPLENVVIAFTLSPEEISTHLERKAPSLEKRIQAVKTLQEKGWQVGLRFDPLIFFTGYQEIYASFFQEVFMHIDPHKLHSVTLGSLRFPKTLFKNIQKLYPDEKLYAFALQEKDNTISYKEEIDKEFIGFCKQEVLKYVSEEKLTHCLR